MLRFVYFTFSPSARVIHWNVGELMQDASRTLADWARSSPNRPDWQQDLETDFDATTLAVALAEKFGKDYKVQMYRFSTSGLELRASNFLTLYQVKSNVIM